MSVDCGAISKVVAPVKTFVYDNIKDYVGYIGSCEDNLCSLRKNLSDVCNKKEDINKKVKEGEYKLERITREAASWLKDVRLLTGETKLKSLMYKDIETAKFVMKLMGKKDLKKLVREDSDMQQLAVEVMDMLKEEMDKSEDWMRLIAKEDYKTVAEVVVELMKDTTEEFKKLMIKDKKVAIMSTKMLKDSDLDKLTKDDKEMQDIVREARSVIDEEESDVFIVHEEEAVNENVILKAAKKLVVPLENLLSLAGKLMDDANFKNAVPEAEDVKFGLDVIDGLLLKNRGFKKAMVDNTRQYESCCCCFCAFVPSYYHNRYKVSIAAETLAKRIDNDIMKKCPGHPVTVSVRLIDMKQSPTQFLKGLQSRDRLLQEILQILREDQDHAVGIYGMGGCGKTTLAKEVAYVGVDMLTIMVEISECPDIGRIQGTISESINLPLHDVHDIAHRATKLYNGLILEKEKKILIILDNVWEKLNLVDIGIPSTCKLLLTTREKEVCRLMGVKDANTRQVDLLDASEGKSLLCSQAGDKGDTEEYKTVIDRLLSKCGGLPLAIVVTANVLKGKDLPSWRKFADELEKPLSFQLTSGDHRASYSILSTSYRFIESKEKRMFFLLCCLWCFDSHISIKAVTRCGIGLDLFPHANKLSEAVDQADRWADELMSSSLLLKPDLQGYLKIHDVVRAFGISFAATDDGHKLLVDAIPWWMNKKTLTEYSAISLLANNDYSRLIGMESDKLQILLLKSMKIPESPGSFSGTMTNLEVLFLKNMNFLPKLPESIGKLMKLRTLSLESCKLGDIKVIGELVNLSVLSLRDSHLAELPNEIGKLINLRLLDLSDCSCKFRPVLANILGDLSELEGLFMFNIFENHSVEFNEDGGTSYAPRVIEFNNLHYLNALEMHIRCAEQLSVDAQFVKNLDSFRICVSYRKQNYSYALEVGSFLRILYVRDVDMGEMFGKRTFEALLKKADWLRLSSTDNFSILFDELDDMGLPELRHLEINNCRDVTFVVNLKGKHDLLIFPNLRFLKLYCLPEMKGIWNGEAPPEICSNLQHLSFYLLDNLQYVLPFARASYKLTKIEVTQCESLKFIFSENASAENEETDVMELPFLKSLDLSRLDHLVSLVGSENLPSTVDGVQERQVFFSPRIVFSALEQFSLVECNKILKLWDKELGISSFRSLKTIKIAGCGELSSLGPLSIFSTLLQLESLTIERCKSMREVITTEGAEELEKRDQVAIFPKLKDLVITSSSNLKSFYGGRGKFKFPSLKNLRLSDLNCLNKFVGSEHQSVLFHEEMDFPCLEELKVSSVNDEVMGLWDWRLEGGSTSLLNPVPMLRKLTLSKINGWKHMPPILCKNLSALQFEMFNDELLLSLGNKVSVWTYSQLPKLKDLCLDYSQSLKHLLRKEDFDDAAALTFCEQLKSLKLNDLPKLKIFPLHLFKSLCSLLIGGLSWEYVFSADTFVHLLQQLETLEIRHCESMRVVVIQDDGEGDVGLVSKFPRLRKIRLDV